MKQHLDKIAEGAKRVHDAAALISIRIALFQDWLSTQPGRVETEYTNNEITIRFARQGKYWILFFQDQNGNLQPLVDGSLKIKLEAMRCFPELLERMGECQTDLIARLLEALRKFDEFFEEAQSCQAK